MRELAARLGVIHSWVGKIELGERRPDLIEYIRYFHALEIDPHEGLDLVLLTDNKTDLLAAEGGSKYKIRNKK